MLEDAEISAQLRRILCSSSFLNSARSTQFLRFCVQRTIEGYASELKETTIAVEVFNRPTSYDPKRDPIVRVHARRVREKLTHYYGSTGLHDPIKIDLPKGGYVPLISRSAPAILPASQSWPEPPPPPVPEAPILSETPHSPARSLWWIYLALAIALFVVATAVFVLKRTHPQKAPVIANELAPMEPASRFSYDPVWSPDGHSIAFAAATAPDRPLHIYIQDIRSGTPAQRLTTEALPETRPTWSPGGTEIAFAQETDLSHFEVIRVTLSDRKLHPLAHIQRHWRLAETHPALDWSPDGKYLLTAEQASPLAPMRLILLSTTNGERKLLTSPPSESSGDIDAKFSPDGQHIAFQRGGMGDLYTVSANGEAVEAAKQLTFGTHGVRGIAWADAGHTIVFGSQRDHSSTYRLWKIPAIGGTPEPLTPHGFDAILPSISPTQGLILLHRKVATDIVEHSLDDSATPHTLLSSSASDRWPRYAPDGKSLAFVSTRSGAEEIWSLRQGEKTPQQLTHFQGEGLVFWPSWSPDSQAICFSFRKDGATSLYTYSFRDHTVRQITTTSKRHFNPIYSSDGNYIYFSSNDDGMPRIARVRTDAHSRTESLFWDGLTDFVLAPNGRSMYFIREEENGVSLIRRDLQEGTLDPIAHFNGRLACLNDLTIVGDSLYLAVQLSNTSPIALYRIDPTRKDVHLVTQLSSFPTNEQASFAISPDQKSIAITHPRVDVSLFYKSSQIH